MIFGNFPLGGLGNFWYTGGLALQGEAPKSRGGAEDFDEFGKNVLEKFLKIK